MHSLVWLLLLASKLQRVLVTQYGYFPNPEKTWLVVKEEHYEAANATFAGSGIQLTRLGRQYLGYIRQLGRLYSQRHL